MKIADKKSFSVKYFSILAQITDKRAEDFSLNSGQDINHLLKLLGEKYPDIKKYVPYIRVAVNQAYVSLDYQPSDNDEIALITPVSGG